MTIDAALVDQRAVETAVRQEGEMAAGEMAPEAPALAEQPFWRAPLMGLLSGIAWLIIALIYQNPLYDEFGLVASAAILGAAVGFYIWRPRPDWEGFRFLGFIAFAQIFLGSGVSVVQSVTGLRFTPASGAFSFAVVASFIFTAVFVFGLYLFLYFAPRKKQPDGPVVGVSTPMAFVLAVGNFIAVVANSTSLTRLGSLPMMIFAPTLIVPLIVATYVLRRKTILLIPLAITFSGQAFVLLLTSSLGTITFFARDALVAYVCLRKAPPWRGVLAIAAIVAFLSPAKYAFRDVLVREATERTTAYAFGSVERAYEVWEDSLEKTWRSDSDKDWVSENLRKTASRFDYNQLAALVFTVVPTVLPFESGATYADIPLLLIPRILYPDKPLSTEYFRTRWTVKLGLQDYRSGQWTALAIPSVAEAYWNFGWLGLFGVPLLVGVAVGILTLLTPRDAAARTAYLVLLSSIVTGFLDMMMWLVTALAIIAVNAMLVRLYVRRKSTA